MKKIYRKIRVLFGARRYHETNINGFIFYYDYITENQIVYIKDMANYMGFNSVAEAMKSEIFYKAFADSGMNLNVFLERLIYTAYSKPTKK